jgi:hypothetical protein
MNTDVLTVPDDLDLERAVLAEILDPLHPGLHDVDRISGDDFRRYRHAVIVNEHWAGKRLRPVDVDYAVDTVRFARPLEHGDLERFRDLARRRRRLVELERERLALCDLDHQWGWPTHRPAPPSRPPRVYYVLPPGTDERRAAIDPGNEEPFG